MTPRLRRLVRAVEEIDGRRIEAWGRHAAIVLAGGGRVLTAGNGGSAAEAMHFTGELVGRFLGPRRPLSSIALCAEAVGLTAITNDFGADEMFARGVRAHGRPGDIFVALSTSGRSTNVLAAVDAAREEQLTTWALTGPRPNTLASRCDDAIAVSASETATIQEVHLVVIHQLCEVIDACLPDADAAVRRGLEVGV